LLRAIVFDFDGVIANSEPLHYRAFRDVFAGAGVDLAERDYYARYLGYDDAGVFRAVAGDRGLPWTPEHVAGLVAAKAKRIEQIEPDVSILFPGASAAIRRAAGAMPIAIASGAIGAEIRRVLDREGLASCFTAIVAAEDTPRSKPEPDPYHRAVDLLRRAAGDTLLASECVALEDSPWGLQSARSAGLHTVAVAHTYPATALDAELVVSSLDELDLDRVRRLCAV
jgi:beta-phosphoglucomutase-like phosphatase (HAD superfamily)